MLLGPCAVERGELQGGNKGSAGGEMIDRVASGLHHLPFQRDVFSTNLFSLNEGKLAA